MFTRVGVIQEYARQDEGNAYLRLGEARAAHEKGIRQAEKFGHSSMAEEDLHLALVELGDRGRQRGRRTPFG